MRPLGVHHVGVPVRDLDRSLAWYRKVFGLEPDFVAQAAGPTPSRTLQLEDVRLRFAFLSLGNSILELLEYEHPVGDDFQLRNCDVGAIHVCFEVDDIRAVYRHLLECGVTFSIPPTPQAGRFAGHHYCYFRDPDGIQLQLWQSPDRDGVSDGLPHDRDGD